MDNDTHTLDCFGVCIIYQLREDSLWKWMQMQWLQRHSCVLVHEAKCRQDFGFFHMDSRFYCPLKINSAMLSEATWPWQCELNPPNQI